MHEKMGAETGCSGPGLHLISYQARENRVCEFLVPQIGEQQKRSSVAILTNTQLKLRNEFR